MQIPPLLVAALFGLMAMPATAGTQTFDVSVRNAGDLPLACDATIAHWYSNALGDIAPGETLRFTLLSDPADGTVFLRNTAGDDMPVQRLWCGLKGRSWETRAEITLERRAGSVPDPIALDCSVAADRTSCAARP